MAVLVPGYKAVVALMEALGIPKTLEVTRLTLDARIPGPCLVTVEHFVRQGEMDTVVKTIQTNQWALAEKVDEPTRMEGEKP